MSGGSHAFSSLSRAFDRFDLELKGKIFTEIWRYQKKKNRYNNNIVIITILISLSFSPFPTPT